VRAEPGLQTSSDGHGASPLHRKKRRIVMPQSASKIAPALIVPLVPQTWDITKIEFPPFAGLDLKYFLITQQEPISPIVSRIEGYLSTALTGGITFPVRLGRLTSAMQLYFRVSIGSDEFEFSGQLTQMPLEWYLDGWINGPYPAAPKTRDTEEGSWSATSQGGQDDFSDDNCHHHGHRGARRGSK
jgi:hypothetical protein